MKRSTEEQWGAQRTGYKQRSTGEQWGAPGQHTPHWRTQERLVVFIAHLSYYRVIWQCRLFRHLDPPPTPRCHTHVYFRPPSGPSKHSWCCWPPAAQTRTNSTLGERKKRSADDVSRRWRRNSNVNLRVGVSLNRPKQAWTEHRGESCSTTIWNTAI